MTKLADITPILVTSQDLAFRRPGVPVRHVLGETGNVSLAFRVIGLHSLPKHRMVPVELGEPFLQFKIVHAAPPSCRTAVVPFLLCNGHELLDMECSTFRRAGIVTMSAGRRPKQSFRSVFPA